MAISETEKGKLPQDKLNELIGVLTRREVEARILAPMINAMSKEFGPEKVLKVVRDAIVSIARGQGAELNRTVGGNSLAHFEKTLKFWTKDDALDIEVIERTDDAFYFDVKHCAYADMYARLGIAELGCSLSCARDFALIEGFNRNITLRRTQTIMEGAPFCDFRYQLKKAE